MVFWLIDCFLVKNIISVSRFLHLPFWIRLPFGPNFSNEQPVLVGDRALQVTVVCSQHIEIKSFCLKLDVSRGAQRNGWIFTR